MVTGPIGAGKSTVARGLGKRYRAAGLSAAVVDFDDVFSMGSSSTEQSQGSWRRAQRVHGALIGSWLRSGIDAVIAHGPFYAEDECAALLAEVPPSQVSRWVMLLASYEVALERVTRDKHPRNRSKDPVFLRATHERFNDLLPDIPRCEWVFDTSLLSADEIVSALGDCLTAPDK